jgi:hypothetical protein
MARSEMRWEMGFSASEIASTAFSNPKIVRTRGTPPHTTPAWAFGPRFGLCPQWIGLWLIFRDIGLRPISCLGTGAGVVASNLHNLIANWRGSPSGTFRVLGSVLNWLISYLSDRNQSVVLNGVKYSPLPTKAGVPQGSVLVC